MRKRNCDRIFDNIMWYLLYLLPLIVSLFIYRSPKLFDIIYEQSGYIPTSFGAIVGELIGDMGFIVDGDNLATFIYDVLGLFGTTGSEAWLAQYFAYFVVVYCAHLFVDFILFIPRLCHKWMNAFTRTED